MFIPAKVRSHAVGHVLGRSLSGSKEKKESWEVRYEAYSRGPPLTTPWLFEPAKSPDDRADYRLDCSFLLQSKHQKYSFLQLSGLGRALWANSGEGSAQ